MKRIVLPVLLALASPALAEDCPTAATAKTGFILQRANTQAEVRPTSDLFTHVVNTYPNGKKQDVIYFRGLVVMSRTDSTAQSLTIPLFDLRSLFPLDVGAKRAFAYVSAEPNRVGRPVSVDMAVTGKEKITLGPCSYEVLAVRNRFMGADGRVTSEHTDYYAPELGFVIAKRYEESGGRQTTVRYESIRPLGPT